MEKNNSDFKEYSKKFYKNYCDVVTISQCVKLGYIRFYADNNYIYCENTFTQECVIVGEKEVTLNVDFKLPSPEKVFESLATIDVGSIGKTRGM